MDKIIDNILISYKILKNYRTRRFNKDIINSLGLYTI